MKKSILLLAACSIALVGCKQEKDEGAMIKINANVQSSTKAAVEGIQFPKGATDVFAVTATKASGDFAAANIHFASAPVSMTDAEPTVPAFSPAQFYPSEKTQKLFFYAYAPMKGAKYNAATETTPPVVKYLLDASSSDAAKCDIMWAKDVNGCSKESGTNPNFTFEHKLMMFKFTVTGSAVLNGKYIKSVALLDQPIEANLNVATGDLTFTEESVGVPIKGTISAYNCGTTEGIAIPTTDKSDAFGCAMIAPSTAKFKVEVTFGGQAIDSPESTLVAEGELTTPAQGIAGYAHTIDMTMNPAEITMKTTITDWIPGDGGSVKFE